MSFLRNLRSSVSRKNSERSTTTTGAGVVQVKKISKKSVKSNCVIEKDTLRKVETVDEEQFEGVLRSGTYTIIDENGKVLIKEEINSTPPSSQLPVKRNMFSKFGTFTRKKKAPSPKSVESEVDSESQISYKIQPSSDVSNDPFNVLYQPNVVHSKKQSDGGCIDYGTYRKNKVPSHIKEQLDELRLDTDSSMEKSHGHDDSEKYKTVTLRSFQKSFRENFLNQQKDVPYNPAWFVEVEKKKSEDEEKEEEERKRRDLLVFENENYRPTARSPIRNVERSPSRGKTSLRSPPRKSATPTSDSRSRTKVRSSLKKSQELSESRRKDNAPKQTTPLKPIVTVKRNETFKIERKTPEPSIRIEIKNSISPNEPGRIVPVGVAKPMPTSSPIETYPTYVEHRTPTRRYQTSIQINESSSPGQYGVYRPRVEGQDNYFTGRNTNSRSYTTSKPSVSSLKPSKPIVQNYSPLTSYELLTKIRPKTTMNTSTINPVKNIPSKDPSRSSGKSFNSTQYSSEQWNYNQPNLSTSNKQKTSIYVPDNSVRKDIPNKSGSNKKRLRIKLPWR